MRIAVVGGSGRIGKRVASYAVERGHEVRTFNRRPERVPVEGVTRVQGDVADREALTRFFAGADAIVYAATVFRVDPASYVPGVRNALAAARDAGVARVVFPHHYSTLRIDGEPVTRLFSAPPAYDVVIPEFKASLRVIREEAELDWLVVTAPVAVPPYHEVTGDYLVSEGDDLLVPDPTIGVKSAVLSMEDFASFSLDQAVAPTYHRTRVTLCNPYSRWQKLKDEGVIRAWI